MGKKGFCKREIVKKNMEIIYKGVGSGEGLGFRSMNFLLYKGSF